MLMIINVHDDKVSVQYTIKLMMILHIKRVKINYLINYLSLLVKLLF